MPGQREDLYTKLNHILDTKSAIKSAIVSGGQDLENTVPFHEYPDYIQKIGPRDPMELEDSITITADNLEQVGERLMFQPPQNAKKAYKNVNVDINWFSRELNVTENGHYDAVELGASHGGWEKININVPEQGAGPDDLVTGIGRIEKNGTYTPASLNKDFHAFDTVNVDVDTDLIIDEDEPEPEPEPGPFTVTFIPGNGMPEYVAENVPYGGSAEYIGPYPERETDPGNYYFTGWNPKPSNVRSNMTCHPLFEINRQIQPTFFFISSPVDVADLDLKPISDTWKEICSNRGTKYPIGSFKFLFPKYKNYVYNSSTSAPLSQFDYTFLSYCGIRDNINPDLVSGSIFVKIDGDGEGYSSKWAEMGFGGFGIPTLASYNYFYNQNWLLPEEEQGKLGYNGKAGWITREGWKYTKAKKFLDEMLFYMFPDVLQDSIRTVTNYSAGISVNSVQRQSDPRYFDAVQYIDTDEESRDKIFPLAITEVIRRERLEENGYADYILETKTKYYPILTKAIQTMPIVSSGSSKMFSGRTIYLRKDYSGASSYSSNINYFTHRRRRSNETLISDEYELFPGYDTWFAGSYSSTTSPRLCFCL